ncbi:MAG: hypothetical protein MZU95_09075 [Desulfomicrobium escambiense]|nr:hypothetical protein [Desulfomicrobium escambiense]
MDRQERTAGYPAASPSSARRNTPCVSWSCSIVCRPIRPRPRRARMRLHGSGLSYVALRDASNGRRTLDTFLEEYPPAFLRTGRTVSAGPHLPLRIWRHEEAIQLFAAFLEKHPDHSFASSALFWTGDSLFYLGRLSGAETVLRTLASGLTRRASSSRPPPIAFPHPVQIPGKRASNPSQVEPRWDPCGSSRIFERREKAHEQALAVRQRRLSESGAPLPAAAPTPAAG